jgi:dethiobiotin synthetase
MKNKKKKSATKLLFVTATNTDVGKSYACAKLLKKYAQKGLKVGYFKPIETGVRTQPQDGSKLLQLAQKLNKDFKVNIHDVVPYQFKLPAAPYVAKKDEKISIKIIINKLEYLKQFCDVLIIEGAGGLMVPIKKNYFIIDLIKDFNAKTILITPSKLGCINDTLLSMQALKKRKIKFKWYVNLYLDKDSFNEVTLPFYQTYFKKISYL